MSNPNSKSAPNVPAYEVFAVTRKNPDDKGYWQKIGVLWPHRDGKGFNQKLELLPFAGQEIVIRERSAKTETQEGGAA